MQHLIYCVGVMTAASSVALLQGTDFGMRQKDPQNCGCGMAGVAALHSALMPDGRLFPPGLFGMSQAGDCVQLEHVIPQSVRHWNGNCGSNRERPGDHPAPLLR